MITVILDNGHGIDTKGKCSPDGKLKEYSYCREIVRRIAKQLDKEGIPYHILVPEENDITLGERERRANKVHSDCKKKGGSSILISVHLNAAGNGLEWMTASGFSDWVYQNCSANSRKLGALLYDEAAKLGLQGNRSVPPSKVWDSQFYILKYTNMPAVLTENLFQDNMKECEFLLSEEGKNAIAKLHVEAIKKYIYGQ